MDGREGRRLGGDAAPRQGGRDQRALVQRAAAAGALAARRGGDGRAQRALAAACRRARASFNDRFWYADGRLPVRRRGRRAPATTRLPPEPAVRRFAATIPCSIEHRWAPVLETVRERLLTPVGLRSLAPGHPDYKRTLLRRPARARRGLPSGHRLGLADRPVRRRLAAGAPGRPRRRAAAARGLHRPPGRGVHRLDQRDLRRRGAVHAARLRRAGVERRRGAAVLGQDESTASPGVSYR